MLVKISLKKDGSKVYVCTNLEIGISVFSSLS